MNEFKDRVAPNLNRKKYIIEENTVARNECGEIISFIAEEIRYDDPEDGNEGTALNSENLNNIVKGMINDVVSLLPLTDETIAAIDKYYLKIPTNAVENFELPSSGGFGSIIEWKSTNSNVIEISNSTAIVTRYLTTKTCILIATIKKGSSVLTKEFVLTIPYRLMTDEERVEDDSLRTLISEYVTSSFSLPTTGIRGSTIKWVVATEEGVTLTTDNRVEFERSTINKIINLSGTFTYGNASVNKIFKVIIVGTNCYTPKQLDNSIIQVDGMPKTELVKVTTTNLEGLYVVIENDNENYITFEIENNDSNEVSILIKESEELNSLNESGTYIYDYKVNVYLSSDHTLLLGTINGSLTYYATSNIPED